MVDSAVNLSIGTELDFSGLERDLAALKNQKFELNIDPNKMGRMFREANRQMSLKPRVDLSELHELNRLLDVKIAHVKQVQRYFNANPLKVKTDARSEQFVKQFAQIRFGTITVRDTRKEQSSAVIERGLNILIAETRKNRPQKSGGIGSVIGNAATLPFKVAGDVVTAPFKAAGRVFDDAIRGFGEDLGRVLSEEFARTAIQRGSQKVKSGAVRFNQSFIGDNQVYETLFAEILRSGNVKKAAQAAFARTNAAKDFDRLTKLQGVLTIDDPEQKQAALDLLIQSDKEIKKIYDAALQKLKAKYGALKDEDITRSTTKKIELSKTFIQDAVPTRLTTEIVNPLIKELQPLLRFIQGMQSYNTNVLAQRFYNERKAGFPKLKQGESVVNVIGGAQGNQGQGGRKLAMAFQPLAPDARFMPVENLDTDNAGRNPFEEWFKDVLKNLGFDAKSIENTALNVFRQISYSLSPTGSSVAAAQAIANTRLAEEQGAKASTMTYSLGGAEGIRLANATQYAGMDPSKILALAYPFLNLAESTPKNFKAVQLAGDPLTFGSMLGLGFETEQYKMYESSLQGANAHGPHHLFKQVEFLQEFFDTVGQGLPEIKPRQAAKIVEAANQLYEIIGSAEQVKSLLVSGKFDMKSPFKGFIGENSATAEEVITKFLESKGAISDLKGKGTPQSKQLAKQLESYIQPILRQLEEYVVANNITIPGDISDNFAGFFKYRKEALGVNNALDAFKTGQKPSKDNSAYFAGQLDPKEVKKRMAVLRNETIDWFEKNKNMFGDFGEPLVEIFKEVERVAEEFVRTNGNLSQEFKDSIETFSIEGAIPPEVESFLNKSFNSYDLPTEEQSRVLQVEVPEAFKKTQSAILAYNQLLEALTADVLPQIKKIKAVASGMSGAAALLTNELVYKTDIDPSGQGKIASQQEVAAYQKLQGRLSPLLYQAVPGKALVTERVKGKSLKEILDRIAQPILAMQSDLDIEKDDAKRKELQAKIDKAKARFNKAAEILYGQVGQLGAAMQEMGVAHNDLASGNVFFTPEGITSIDLGNAVTDPTTIQKIQDQATTIQRAIIDRAFYGLLDPIRTIKAINQGYKNPLTLPGKRQPNMALLSPQEKGEAIPLGSETPVLLEKYLGSLMKFPVKAMEEVAQVVPDQSSAIVAEHKNSLVKTVEEKAGVIVGKIEDVIVGLFNNALMAVPGEGGTLDLNAPQIAKLKDINPQILALLTGKGLQQTAISGTRGARNLYGVAKGAEDAFLGLDPSGAAKMVKDAITPLALTAAASQIPGAGLAVEGAVQIVETALGPLANVLGAEMIQAISGAIAETVGGLPIIGSQLEAGLVQLIAEAVTAALAGGTGILASGAVGKGLQLAGSAAANAIAPGSEAQSKLLQGQTSAAATKALKGLDRIIGALSSVQLPGTVSAFPKMLPQVSTPKQLQAYLDQNLNEKGVRDVFKQLTGKTGTGMGRKALTGVIGGNFSQDPQKVQQAIAKVVDEGIKSGGAKVGVNRGAIDPKTIDQLKKSVQQTNKFIKQFDESGAEIQAQVGDRLAVLANFLQNELSSVQAIKQNFAVDGKQGQQLSGVESQLKAKLKQIQERMKSVGIGEELVNGIVKGVQGNAGEVTDVAQNMAQDVIDATKDQFGIQSPSKVFMQIGRDIVAGLAKGTDPTEVLGKLQLSIGKSLGTLAGRIQEFEKDVSGRKAGIDAAIAQGASDSEIAAMVEQYNMAVKTLERAKANYAAIAGVKPDVDIFEQMIGGMSPEELQTNIDDVIAGMKVFNRELLSIQERSGLLSRMTMPGSTVYAKQVISEGLGRGDFSRTLRGSAEQSKAVRNAIRKQIAEIEKEIAKKGVGIQQAIQFGADPEQVDKMVASVNELEAQIDSLRQKSQQITEVTEEIYDLSEVINGLSLEEFEAQLPELSQKATQLVGTLDEITGVQQELGAKSEKTKTKVEQFTNALLQLFKGGDIVGGLKQVAGVILEVGDAGEKSFAEIFSEVGDRFGFDNVKEAFKDLGASVAGVFASAFSDTPIGEGLSAALQRLAGSLTAGLTRITARITDALPGIVRAFTGVFNRVGAVASQSLENIANNFGGFTRNVVTAIASFVGLRLLLRPLDALGRASFDTALEVEQLTRSLSFSTAEGGVATLEKIRQKANELNVSFAEAAQGYAQLAASTFGTNLEGQTDNIFEGVATAISARGLSQENQQRAFLAISQIASKGKVSMEELTGQLGEALPGALQTAARALGLTTAELTRMVSNGEVLAEDFLPKFAAQLSLEASGSVAAAAGTASAQLTKMNNNLEQIRATIGQGILDGLRVVLPTINSALGFLSENIETVMSVVTALAALLSVTFAKSALKLAGDLKLLDMVLTALNIDMAAVRAQMEATTPVSFNLGAAFTALGVKLKAFAVSTKANLLAALTNIKAFFVNLPAAIAKAGTAVKAFGVAMKGLLLAAGKFAVLIIALSSLASVFQTANPEIVGMTQGFKALNKEIEKNNRLRAEGAGPEIGIGNDIESQTYSRPTWLLKLIPGWLGGGNKAIKEFTYLTRNLQKAQEEAISALGNASESFVGVSDEDLARIKEIDKTLRQLRVESNIANEQGGDTTGIKDRIRALTEERENIVKNVQGYGTLQGSVQQGNELISAYRQLIESDARNADYYRGKIRELEDAMAPATAQLQDYADATNSVTVNIRKLSAEMQGVLNRISQLRSDAERTATTDQVDLLRQRLSGELSGTEFSLGQVQITQESTNTIAEGLEKELANAQKIAREFYREIPAELRMAFNAVGISGGIENILDKATGELIDQAQTKFATAGGDLDATGEAALKALRDYVQIRDETLNIQREVLEQDLEARQQLADAVQQGIDRIRGRLDFEEEQSSLGNAIAENMAIAGRALSDFEKQVLQTGNSINQLITEAENFDRVAEENSKAAMQSGLLPEDKAQFEREAKKNSLLAENARAQAAATAADLERSKAIREYELAVKAATVANDQWYQSQRNTLLLEQANGGSADGSIGLRLTQLEENYALRRIRLKEQEIAELKQLRAQDVIDQDRYINDLAQLETDLTSLQGEEAQRRNDRLRLQLEQEQAVFDLQIRAREKAEQLKSQAIEKGLAKQEKLIQKASESVRRNAEDLIKFLETKLQESQKKLEALNKDKSVIESIRSALGLGNVVTSRDQGALENYISEARSLIRSLGIDAKQFDLAKLEEFDASQLLSLIENLQQAKALGIDASDLGIAGLGEIQAKIKEQELDIEKQQLNIEQQRQLLQQMEEAGELRLLAIEQQRDALAKAAQQREAKLEQLRAQREVQSAQNQLRTAKSMEEVQQAMIALQSAQLDLGFANQMLGLVSGPEMNMPVGFEDGKFQLALDEETKKFLGEDFVNALQNIRGDINPQLRAAGQDGYQDFQERLNATANSVERGVQQRLPDVEAFNNLGGKFDNLSGQIAALNQTLRNQRQASNITINGSASMAETIQLMREANR